MLQSACLAGASHESVVVVTFLASVSLHFAAIWVSVIITVTSLYDGFNELS